jgi:hypothetical protein
VNSLIIPGQLNCDRTPRDFRVRCIALAALHCPFPLYFLCILYTNTANNNSTDTEKRFALITFCAAAAGLIQT